jgi:multisubunit Na+/H+ antiporter MnhB subunit
MSTLILRTAARLLVPLSLAFAVFVYFKGHQMPGGGFVAGLVTAVALVVHRMCEGPGSLQKLLPATERTIIAIGLALALGTGMAAMAFGLPFLSSNYGYWPLPGGDGYVEWATVMTFDLGVMLVVAGVVVGMIDALSREME